MSFSAAFPFTSLRTDGRHISKGTTLQKLGRLSFNPFSHLDPIGTIMIFLFGIGYAKPVPINPLKFKNYRKGVALTALAGPFSNLVMSFILRLSAPD